MFCPNTNFALESALLAARLELQGKHKGRSVRLFYQRGANKHSAMSLAKQKTYLVLLIYCRK